MVLIEGLDKLVEIEILKNYIEHLKIECNVFTVLLYFSHAQRVFVKSSNNLDSEVKEKEQLRILKKSL